MPLTIHAAHRQAMTLPCGQVKTRPMMRYTMAAVMAPVIQSRAGAVFFLVALSFLLTPRSYWNKARHTLGTAPINPNRIARPTRLMETNCQSGTLAIPAAIAAR